MKSKMSRSPDYSKSGLKQTCHTKHMPWTKKELLVAKAIFEAKYPDAKFKNLHPNRLIRLQRLLEARAVMKILE